MKFFTNLCVYISLLSTLIAAPVTIQDKKGRSIRVNLISMTGTVLKCKKATGGNVISIPFSKLDDASAKLVKEKLEKIQAEAAKKPPLDLDVSINKRRKPSGDSYYMKRMEITAKITVKNKNLNIEATSCQGRMVLIGQDQKDTDTFEVLLNEKFKITPSHQGQEHLTKKIVTEYDSDNKGDGNIGGAKYYGYVLVLSSSDGDTLGTKTTILAAKKMMGTQFIKSLEKLKVGSEIDKNFAPN